MSRPWEDIHKMEGSNGLSRWQEIRNRLDVASKKIGREKRRDPDPERLVLKQRARALARKKRPGEQDQDRVEVVEFFLAHEHYALELLHIREVCSLKLLTRVPGAPSFLLGIVNIRGRMISVVDLKRFFDLPDKGLTDLNRIIILQSDEMEFAILADEIIGVRHIISDQIQPVPATFAGLHKKHIKGVTQDQVVLLDGEKILRDNRMILDSATEA